MHLIPRSLAFPVLATLWVGCTASTKPVDPADTGPTAAVADADTDTDTDSDSDADADADTDADTDAGFCEPTTCADQAATCGDLDDGCGEVLDCGDCGSTEACVANVCETTCTEVAAVFFDLGETLVTDIGGPNTLLFEPIDGAQEMIDALLADGKRLGIITNTLPGWDLEDLRALLTEPELLDDFEVVLISSLATANPKPDPAIFAEAHSLMVGAPPLDQTAFVSEELDAIADQVANPTEGARAAGMLGVHLTSGAPSPLTDHSHSPDQLTTLPAAAWLNCD